MDDFSCGSVPEVSMSVSDGRRGRSEVVSRLRVVGAAKGSQYTADKAAEMRARLLAMLNEHDARIPTADLYTDD